MRFAAPRHLPLTASCLVLLAAGFSQAAEAEVYEKSYSVTGRANVRVQADDGNVRFIPSEARKVEFRVTYEGYTLGKTLLIESRQDGERVELTERIPPHTNLVGIPFERRRVSIEVRAPKDSDLVIETGDGNVEVSSVKGVVALRTGDGDVRASQLSGTIELRTRDGDIRAESLSGDLKLRSGDGRIEGERLDGKCIATSGDGQIHLAGRFDELDVSSGDGGLIARIGAGSTMGSGWRIRTGDGEVELELPRDFKADLDASTGDGRIKLGLPVTVQGDFGTSKVRGAINGGGQPLNIRTGDGSIRISGSAALAPGVER